MLVISLLEYSSDSTRALFAPRTNTRRESKEFDISSNTFRETAKRSQNSEREKISEVKR